MNSKQVVFIVFGLGIIFTVLFTNPDMRNERVECLKLMYSGNPYAQVPQSGHVVNTGLLSYAVYYLLPNYRMLAILFWVVIFGVTYRHINNWLLLGLFAFFVFRTALYQHEEVYWGLPLIYVGLFCRNNIIKGIASGLSLTVRPVYVAYILHNLIPRLNSGLVWSISMVIACVCYMAGLWVFGGDFFYLNNLTSVFRGGATINYSLWFLDYALLILLPMIWLVGKSK